MKWLHFNPDKLSLGETEIKYLCSFFESSPHDPLRVVTSLDGINVDFKSVSTLVGERYIDNFIIDYCLKKSLINSQKQTKSTSSILCLPAEALSWLENQDLDPIKTVIQKDLHHPSELKLILMPVHMEDKHHWGLVCVDLDMVAIWYDDGLKVAPPENLCNSVGTLLKLLGDMFPQLLTVWHIITFPHSSIGEWVCLCRDLMVRQLVVEAVGWELYYWVKISSLKRECPLVESCGPLKNPTTTGRN